jgi:hypothetical protein
LGKAITQVDSLLPPSSREKQILGDPGKLGIELIKAAEEHDYKNFCRLLAKVELLEKRHLWRLLEICRKHFRDIG